MKRSVAILLCLLIALSCVGCAGQQQETALTRAQQWVEKQMQNDTLFTFAYDGLNMTRHIDQWEKTVDVQDNAWTLHYRRDGLHAWAEVSLDTELAALEWCAYFENETDKTALPISDIRILNTTVAQRDAVMTTTVGSNAEAKDFSPLTVDMKQAEKYEMSSTGGRSSSGAWPYFDLCEDGQGVLGALGWTGDWVLSFTNTNSGVHVRGGMKRTDIALYAKESMRTPSMVLLFFDGDQDAGHNQFRRLMIKSYTPMRSGEKLDTLPTFINNWGGLGINSHFGAVGQSEGLGTPFEGLWIDAGWYNAEPSDSSHDTAWYRECGSWTFNTEMYPNGLEPLGDYLTEQNKDLMLWFEIERAQEGTAFLKEHEEYSLPKNTIDAFRLYDMGDEEARTYLIDYLAQMFTDNKITCYRQDFNVSPANTWSYADELEGEHRTGITEIHYITGLYAFFDGLYEKIPNLMIDNCASGGRRLDIEMMRRSVTYWPTDFLTQEGTAADDARNINYNLRWWLPVFAFSASREGRNNDYQLRSMYAAGVSLGINVSNRSWYLAAMKDLLEFRRFILGDYYILSAGQEKEAFTENAAYEFYLPDTGEGRLLVFRPRLCVTPTQTYCLKGLEENAVYQITVAENEDTFEMTGADLMTKGLAVTLDEPNTSTMIALQKK